MACIVGHVRSKVMPILVFLSLFLSYGSFFHVLKWLFGHEAISLWVYTTKVSSGHWRDESDSYVSKVSVHQDFFHCPWQNFFFVYHSYVHFWHLLVSLPMNGFRSICGWLLFNFLLLFV